MHRQTIIETLGRLADGPTYRLHLFRMLKTLSTTTRVARERRELAALDDRMLKDIGLSRSVAHRETERPWFDLPGKRFGGHDR